MTHFLRTSLTALCLCVFALAAKGQGLMLHYDRPAYYFEEALVIGNGTMGGIVYGGPSVDKISLNDITLWTGEPEGDPYTPDAYKTIPDIRAALDRGDYALADKLQRKVQGHYSQNYQPLGELLIEYADTTGEVSNYKRWLDISNATCHTVFHRGKYQYAAEYFATNPDSGLVVRITTDNPKGVDVNLSLSCQLRHEITRTYDGFVMDGYAGYSSLPSYTDDEEKFAYDANRGIHFRTIVKKVKGDKSVTIYVVNATSFNGFDKDPVKQGRDYKTLANNQMRHITAPSYNALIEKHINDYKAIFDRVSLRLKKETTSTQQPSTSHGNSSPQGGWEGGSTDKQLLAYVDENLFNPELEALYFQFGRYLLISCSRTPNVPANLQGLWNESILPPWSCNYTSNINLEENYWPAEVANMPEMHLSMLSFLKELQGSGEQTAKAYYGVDKGWCLAHNTDIWAMTNPVGLHSGDPSWANWNMGGAWVSTHIWEHYMFSLDKEFLKEYYPVLKGAAEFCLGWMVEKDGKLMTSPSTSPENIYVNDEGYHGRSLYGGSADMAMIRECLTDALLAARELKTEKGFYTSEEKAFVAKVEKAIAKLMPYKIGKRGNLQEWYYDWDDEDFTHRHQSHLFGLFPGHAFADGVNSTDALKAAAARSLEIKGDKTTGWSTGWRVNLFARLGDADKAYHIYRKLLSYVTPDKYKGPDRRRGGGTYPNMLDAHSPFQIDGNFGGCAGVVEMLMQSEYADFSSKMNIPSITLLPALPDRWKDGEVKGIRARGGFTVDMKWEDKQVKELTITALKKGKVVLRYNGMRKVVKVKEGVNTVSVE